MATIKQLFLLVCVYLILGVAVATNPFDHACVKCICKVESGCKPIGCRMDRGSLSCGYYQIKEAYFTDCKNKLITLPWKKCSNNYACATQCVLNYMTRYGKYCTGKSKISCQDAARIHNGGPKGCHKISTLIYWLKVKACLKKDQWLQELGFANQADDDNKVIVFTKRTSYVYWTT